jgi:formyl transferase-like protein
VRTFLICHEDEILNREVLPRWLASFSQLAGILVLRETRKQKQRRVRREFARVGWWRFADVVAFRLYYRLLQSAADHRWQQERLAELRQRYHAIPAATPVLVSASPNTPQARDFIFNASPDLMIARCKVILKEDIFTIPRRGTFVMHPGICPEYRNAHGCFWALANRDLSRVGMTLLRIDRGVDTGPIFGHYNCSFDERRESHIVIQERMVFDNLDSLRLKLEAIFNDQAEPIDVSGRISMAWGQPWLTKYLAWKRAARRP